MNLIEIRDKLRSCRISAKMYQEIWSNEVDTVDSDSPDAKQQLADEMQRAEKVGSMYRVSLSDESKQYLVDHALPNMIDIARDNQDRRTVTALQKFQAQLHAKIYGEDSVAD